MNDQTLNSTLHEIRLLILGEKPLAVYIAGFFFASLAIGISLYTRGQKKYQESPDTPAHFSTYFLIWDNAKRIVAGMTTMFLLFRFLPSTGSSTIDMGAAVAIGFFVSLGLDKAIQFLQSRFDFLNMDRSKLPTKPQ